VARRRRERLAAPEPLEEILHRAGESRFVRVRPPITGKLWRDAVGARIAERANPISLWGGVLVLRVPSSVWAHELSLLADDVCGRLRQRGIDARELRFRVGPVPAVERPPERRDARAVPAPAPLPHDLARILGQVRDAELRAVIARAAASNLAWQIATGTTPPQPVTEVQRAARAPRFVAAGTAPPDRTSPACRGAPPGTREGGPDRSR
jgi:predicted nucleic acid-binding Zn ribbon protein